MKPIVKICIGISSALLLLGVTAIGIGFLLGVTPAQLVYAGHYPGRFFTRSTQNLEVLDDVLDDTFDDLDDALDDTFDGLGDALDDAFDDLEPVPGLSGSNPAQREEYYEFRDIQSLELELPLCELVVHVHDEDYIAVSADRGNNYFHCNQQGSTLNLTDNRPNSVKSNSMEQALYLDLYLPRQQFKDFELELGAGNLTLEYLSADTVELDNGAGNLTIRELSCKELDVDCGVGEFLAESLTASKEAEIDLGTGTATISYFDGNRLSLDCAVGNAEVTAAGREPDYNYRLDAPGSIYLNHHLQEHHSSHHDEDDCLNVQNGASRQIDIQCALGTATLNFTEE